MKNKIVAGVVVWIITSVLTKMISLLPSDYIVYLFSAIIFDLWPIWFGLIISIFYMLVIFLWQLYKWLTWHSSNYMKSDFNSLEEKINYLIDVKLKLKSVRQI